MLALTHICRRDLDAEPRYLFNGNQSRIGPWHKDKASEVQVAPGRPQTAKSFDMELWAVDYLGPDILRLSYSPSVNEKNRFVMLFPSL